MRAVADVERLCTRPARMDDSLNPFEHRDVDCSGRSLATLLVAWVGAAMVASVLLRWKYMWIALTILTLLFLFACGYAACNARRAQESVIASEEARILAGRGRDTHIQSVSGAVDNYPEVTDPPSYDAYWITDLPPPYAVVIGADPPPLMPRSSRSAETEPTSSPDGPRLSNPPPYSIAILSEPLAMPPATSSHTSRGETPPASSTAERQRPIIEQPTNPSTNRVPASSFAWDEDKNASEQSTAAPNSQAAARPSGAQYLSNIISCTFGIGQRRTTDRNSTAHTTARDRPDTFESSMTTVTTQTSATSVGRISATSL